MCKHLIDKTITNELKQVIEKVIDNENNQQSQPPSFKDPSPVNKTLNGIDSSASPVILLKCPYSETVDTALK